MSAQAYPGNTGNSHLRECSETSRDACEYARSSSSDAAPLANPLSGPKTRWDFDPRNGSVLRAPLELYVPKSQWNFSPYTGLTWTPPPRQLAPNSNQFAPLQQVNQFPLKHASRSATQQSAPYRSTTASSIPRHAYPITSSGNFSPPLPPLTYDGPITAQQNHTQQSNRSSSTINAVSSAGRGVPQLFADAILSDFIIKSVLIETGATFSMIPMRTLHSMNVPPPIEIFLTSPPRIVGVGGASATVRGYIDAHLIIARTQVRHPVIVVEDLSFPYLIGMDILALTTHNSVSAFPAPSDSTSSGAESATKSALQLRTCAQFQPSPLSVRKISLQPCVAARHCPSATRSSQQLIFRR